MAIDFTAAVTDEYKRAVLTQRIAQFTGEGYQHELNKRQAESIGNAEAVAEANKALAIIEDAIAFNQTELDSLPVEVPVVE